MRKNSSFTMLCAGIVALSISAVPSTVHAQSLGERFDRLIDCKILLWTDWTAFRDQCGGDGEFVASSSLASPATKSGTPEESCEHPYWLGGFKSTDL